MSEGTEHPRAARIPPCQIHPGVRDGWCPGHHFLGPLTLQKPWGHQAGLVLWACLSPHCGVTVSEAHTHSRVHAHVSDRKPRWGLTHVLQNPGALRGGPGGGLCPPGQELGALPRLYHCFPPAAGGEGPSAVQGPGRRGPWWPPSWAQPRSRPGKTTRRQAPAAPLPSPGPLSGWGRPLLRKEGGLSQVPVLLVFQRRDAEGSGLLVSAAQTHVCGSRYLTTVLGGLCSWCSSSAASSLLLMSSCLLSSEFLLGALICSLGGARWTCL